MIAIDTNLLVRFLVRDDERQARRARKIIAEDDVFIAKTVLLETEWVLRYTYGFDKAAVAEALANVCGLPQIVVEDASSVRKALAWHESGFDFADALHLAAGQHARAFYTFDRALTRRAKRAPTIPVLAP